MSIGNILSEEIAKEHPFLNLDSNSGPEEIPQGCCFTTGSAIVIPLTIHFSLGASLFVARVGL